MGNKEVGSLQLAAHLRAPQAGKLPPLVISGFFRWSMQNALCFSCLPQVCAGLAR